MRTRQPAWGRWAQAQGAVGAEAAALWHASVATLSHVSAPPRPHAMLCASHSRSLVVSFSRARLGRVTNITRTRKVQDLAMAQQERGHQAPAPAADAPPMDPAVVKLREHQRAVARQSFPDECRTLLRLSRYGVLSTLSRAADSEGFPTGAVVGFADDVATGAPVFCFSTMSGHTQDLLADGRASLAVTAPGFEGAADARVCVTGRVERIPQGTADHAAAQARYLAVHPDAFWATFGDFSFWTMTSIVAIRLVGGFARAGSVPPGLYSAAHSDPVAGACGPQLAYANAYGDRAWVAVITHAVGADVGLAAAKVVSLDKLGLNLMVQRAAPPADAFKFRLAFPHGPAETPQAVHAAIESMLAAAAGATKL